MRSSRENSMKKQIISSIPFSGENGIERCIMRFSEENSIRRNHYAVFRRKQHKKKPVCGFQKKTA